ncbi:MAG: hypothetical protein A2172_00480 [Candidatus Woykebacteria bacterium RBG_13_40_15]|uniref:SCP domain-containing protein n=1 Tax=Candidatus Woykebacteria bacterium RBG_13_40_15 TaxID=1802593 RepID=A0A1G1W9G1_9BACT|nr:MAG: hypothetical protein A2172_00480 [Candidatus Woykebacteria bacterium RBG_13_40_15]
MAPLPKEINNLKEILTKIFIPHHKNNHRPYVLQSSGLTVFLLVLLVGQGVANFQSGSVKILGYATNISRSEIIRLTNIERSKAGFPQLSENSSLDKAATFKAGDMFAKNYWAHYAPDGTSPWYFFNLVGYQYSTAGENLARDFSTSGGVVTAWMASPGHRANILHASFTEIGVAVVNGSLQGGETTLVVQLFGRPVASAAPSASANPSQQGTSAQSSIQGTPSKLEAKLQFPSSTKSATRTVAGNVGSESTPLSTQQGGQPILSVFQNASSSQKVTLALLLIISVFLLIDSIILYRRRQMRVGSHSFAHLSVLLILLVVCLLYGKGLIL